MRVSWDAAEWGCTQQDDEWCQKAAGTVTARELEEVTAKLDKFLYMLEEVQQNLPD